MLLAPLRPLARSRVAVVRPGNSAEREAQADVVIIRQLKQKAVRPERRKVNRTEGMRRRKGDR